MSAKYDNLDNYKLVQGIMIFSSTYAFSYFDAEYVLHKFKMVVLDIIILPSTYPSSIWWDIERFSTDIEWFWID